MLPITILEWFGRSTSISSNTFRSSNYPSDFEELGPSTGQNMARKGKDNISLHLSTELLYNKMYKFYSSTGVPESFQHVLLASKIKYYSWYIIYCLHVLEEISILFLNILSSIKLWFTNKQQDWTTLSIIWAAWKAFPFFVGRYFWTNKICNTPH